MRNHPANLARLFRQTATRPKSGPKSGPRDVRLTAAWLAAVMLLAAASPAMAILGGAPDSVESDRAHFSAQMKSTPAGSYTVHALTLANGEVIREFAGADGVVFAIAWRGPSRPDLRQLLGPRFDILQADNVLPGGRRTRPPLAVRRADFVVGSMGHPGAFRGFALLPGQAPAGFSPKGLW